MATWNELIDELGALGGPAKDSWFSTRLDSSVSEISTLRDNRNVLVYFSAFLQKTDVPPGHTIMMPEDINGFMAAFNAMDRSKGLTVVMHTPGGATMAVQSLVDYTRSMFDDVEVIVPTYAMSAGTMYALASDRIFLGHHSQLGPIDPQLTVMGRQQSARSIVDQFDEARRDIVGDPATGEPGNPQAANLWAPVIGAYAPSLLQFAKDQLEFSESMVAGWLERFMFADNPAKAKEVAAFFNDAGTHKSHDKRIGLDDAVREGLTVEKLETDSSLQDAVLTLYHVLTILAEQTPMTKIISSGDGRNWVKNWSGQAA